MFQFYKKNPLAAFRYIRALFCFGILISICTLSPLRAQLPDPATESAAIDKIYDTSLTNSQCYEWLRSLCTGIGNRLSGSPEAAKAVNWAQSLLDTLGLDSVWLQPCMVPHWVRGGAEEVRMWEEGREQFVSLPALALGGSVGTAAGGITAGVVEIKSWKELEQLGEKGLRGKIAFFNRPMDPTLIRTFAAYGGAVDQRVFGASRAAKYGAVAVLVRSLTLKLDNFPHAGVMIYDTTYARIPAAAISTLAADELSRALRQSGKKIKISIKMSCKTLPDVPSANVIGELRGSEAPGTFITIGGHLDSWDVGQGAHDDGAGVVQSMEVLRLLKLTGYRPRHTIRCVLFMNEENGSRGGMAYAAEAIRKNEKHLLALESDSGGFTPRSFGFEGDASTFDGYFEKIKAFQPLFDPYGLRLSKGGSGADVDHLRETKALLSGYSPDSQRYFDYHHTNDDTFDKVNKRELELGAASMAALVYLADKYLD